MPSVRYAVYFPLETVIFQACRPCHTDVFFTTVFKSTNLLYIAVSNRCSTIDLNFSFIGYCKAAALLGRAVNKSGRKL